MTDIELLEQQAIDAAINTKWEDAVRINKKILVQEKKNLDASLRLGFAYLQLSKLDDARRTYRAVLRVQSGNQLAKENLERIKILEVKGSKRSPKKEFRLDPSLFLELPGRTKSANLVNLGQKNTLAQLIVGQQVYLKQKRRKIEIRTLNNEYVGCLADDLSKRLFLFVKAGSEYFANIKEVSLSRVVVFIREDKKGKKVARYTSFPKDMQVDISRVQNNEASATFEDEDEDVVGNDIEKLAETLSEEKDYAMYTEARGQEDEENHEE